MVYTTPQALYDEGLDSDDYPSAKMTARIAIAQKRIEQITGKFFEAKTRTYYLDGSGLPEMHLPAPCISLTSVGFMSGGVSTLRTLTDFECYPTSQAETQRRILAIATDSDQTIQSIRPFGVFPEGRRNIEVIGSFGWVDEDGNTPVDIVLATQLLAMHYKDNIGDDALQAYLRGNAVKRLKVDDQEIETHASIAKGAFTGFNDVDDLLMPYMYDGGDFYSGLVGV